MNKKFETNYGACVYEKDRQSERGKGKEEMTQNYRIYTIKNRILVRVRMEFKWRESYNSPV